MPFKKILIANRGEIAIRVIRAARELGLKSVAVYSDADRDSPHVLLADEAVHIGESEAKKSYLVPEKILEAAAKTKADALHPGFGFLSENADFARACAKAGLKFIGPNPDAIDLMGDKLRARTAMKAAGVPIVPGSEGAIETLAEAKKIAKEIGFPVILKAAAGGGGKGMRVAHSDKELESFFESVRREALNYFNDGSVFLERYAKDPHHIEVQIIADEHGNVAHLFERECSVQRRHQKVIEEAPSPFLAGHDDIREKLFAVAVQGAKRIGYTNAGTMEFVMDGDRNFYFLEMNTRIQVEHPVTEMITGIDLVKEQILVAAGNKLSFTQDELEARGSAIECRLYAENPFTFLPSPGPVKELLLPGGPFVRVDAALQAGQTVPIDYDPMIAKLCAWGRNRTECMNRMARALAETGVAGCLTNLNFLRFVMVNKVFRSGTYTTGFIAQETEQLANPKVLPPGIESEAELRELLALLAGTEEKAPRSPEPANWWRMTHVR
ncbi:MAG: acetyl-CoA carboxylase biotin carboxylase subunit [Bdellovibrionota bacterium]